MQPCTRIHMCMTRKAFTLRWLSLFLSGLHELSLRPPFVSYVLLYALSGSMIDLSFNLALALALALLQRHSKLGFAVARFRNVSAGICF